MSKKIVTLAMLASACAPAPQEGSLGEDVDRMVQKKLRGGSLVAAVVEDGEITRFAGYGTTEPDAEHPPGRDSPYRVGSISKLFTGVVAMQLVEEGKLDLDAPITDVLPGFRLAAEPQEPITTRHLLTHSSGLPMDRLRGMFSDEPETIEEITAAMAEEELTHEPGLWWAYSNVAFTIAGDVAQSAAGTPYADLVEERIFAPCGMETASMDWAAALTPTLKGEASWEGDYLGPAPAGVAVMGVEDLAKFATAVMDDGTCAGGSLLTPESMAAMAAPQDVGALSGSVTQGLAFQIEPDAADAGGRTVLWHNGGTLHQFAMLRMVPELDVAVIVLSNEATADQLVSEVASELLRQVVAETTGEAPLGAAEPPRPDGDPGDAALDALAGLWATPLGALRVERRGDGLDAKGTRAHARFVPTSTGTFRVRPMIGPVRLPVLLEGAEVRFDSIEGHDVFQLVTLGQDFTMGERVATPVDDAGWGEHVGEWKPVEDRSADAWRVTAARIVDREDHLEIELDHETTSGDHTSAMLIVPLDATRARIAGIGQGMGDVIRVEDGRLRVLGLEFER
jgi:CubicO group peptidase (beta-lactamase class C family)